MGPFQTIAAAAALAGGAASPSAVPPADLAAISAVLADEETAWAQGNAAAYSAHVSDTVIFTNIVGMFAVGRPAFEAQHARIFATIYKGSSLHQTIEHVALLRPDVAVVDVVAAVSGFASLPPGVSATDGVLRARLEQVMVRENGRWQVAAYHNVAINAAALGGGPPPR